MHGKKNSSRLYVIFFIFIFLFFLLISRLFYIQILSSKKLSQIAQRQYNKIIEIPAERGRIYDRNYQPLALNMSVYSLYADPSRIKYQDIEHYVNSLSEILNISTDFLQERLSRQKYFVWIKRHLTQDEKDLIESLNFRGLGFLKERKRFYPNDSLAAHIIGYAGIDNQGLAGLEFSFGRELKGISGYRYINVDAIQRELAYLEQDFVKSHRGYDVVLTIDQVIQYIIEEALHSAVERWQAKGGCIIVMNSKTGEILGMSSYPDFDPNNYRNYKVSSYRNMAVSSVLEPGSVFKIVTAAAVIEENLLEEKEEKIFCENGAYRIHSHVLHDFRPHGYLTFPEVIIHSSNIGMAKLAQRLGEEKLYEYIRRFGFNERTGIELPGEERGILRKPRQWSRISIASIPMGQEIGVTPLQIGMAFSVIANSGKLVKPYIVKSTEFQGYIIKSYSPVVKRKVISKKTADFLKDILIDAVKKGTGRAAAIEGVKVAGKTGTAQKIVDGRYSDNKYVASFAGFLPYNDPNLTIVVVIDEPHPIRLGGTVAAPVFKKVAEEILSYIRVSGKEILAYSCD